MVLALVLTGVLVCQVSALRTMLRSRRLHAARRPPLITDLVWVAIPVAVVLFLAVRSSIVALNLAVPAMALVTTMEVPNPAVSSPIFVH
jgi:hypothetical protein